MELFFSILRVKRRSASLHGWIRQICWNSNTLLFSERRGTFILLDSHLCLSTAWHRIRLGERDTRNQHQHGSSNWTFLLEIGHISCLCSIIRNVRCSCHVKLFSTKSTCGAGNHRTDENQGARNTQYRSTSTSSEFWSFTWLVFTWIWWFWVRQALKEWSIWVHQFICGAISGSLASTRTRNLKTRVCFLSFSDSAEKVKTCISCDLRRITWDCFWKTYSSKQKY